MLINSLKNHGKLSRNEIDNLLWNVVSDLLDDSQKKSKIGNILRKLRTEGVIINKTIGNSSEWSLVNS